MSGFSRSLRSAVAFGAALLLTAATTGAAGAQPAALAAGTTSRVSVGSAGQQADADSSDNSISGDGRFVAFTSNASNLVPGDTNGVSDVFVRDRRDAVTLRVSVGAGGKQADAESSEPSISADGRFIAFFSVASNLVAGDTNNDPEIFVRDRQAGVTLRASVGPGGRQADERSFIPSISPDGRFVAFDSLATNLVAGDTNNNFDVFVRDLVAGTTRRVSLGAGGVQGNSASTSTAISAGGRFVAFFSSADNLVPGDNNGKTDVFVRDVVAGVTRLASISTGGQQANGFFFSLSISADGRYVVFDSDSDNLVAGDTNGLRDVFLRDGQAGLTRIVSVGQAGQQSNGLSANPRIAADGGSVVFWSRADNLVSGDTNGKFDAFVRDLAAAATRRVSIGNSGQQATKNGLLIASISADGSVVAFVSAAPNMVAGDTNGVPDVFVRDESGGGGGSPCTISGTSGNDRIVGTPGPDVICAGTGDDVVYGRGGRDIIFGGAGNDVLHGGVGNDVIRGGAGADVVRGDEGDDQLFGEDGSDTINGGSGLDTCKGGSGVDAITACEGR